MHHIILQLVQSNPIMSAFITYLYIYIYVCICVWNLTCVRDDDDELDGEGNAFDHMISTHLKIAIMRKFIVFNNERQEIFQLRRRRNIDDVSSSSFDRSIASHHSIIKRNAQDSFSYKSIRFSDIGEYHRNISP